LFSEEEMKLTIFAATGGIGRQILDQALLAGHDVTAVVRDPDKLPAGKIRVVAADLRVLTQQSSTLPSGTPTR
jgi:putative NADH-flavin reductase